MSETYNDIPVYEFSLNRESVMQTVSQNESLPEQASREPELEQLIAPGTPIQFDIVLPATEFQDQNRGNR